MGSMRCSTCAINYPRQVQVCPVCDMETWSDPLAQPDDWWEWRATLLKQEAETWGMERKQPYYLIVPIIELVQGRAYAVSLHTVYEYEKRRLMLREGDVIEVPNPSWDDDDPYSTLTLLFETQGTIRPSFGGTHYHLIRLGTSRVFPQEWVAEFSGGD